MHTLPFSGIDSFFYYVTAFCRFCQNDENCTRSLEDISLPQSSKCGAKPLSRTIYDLVANSLAPASRLQQEELFLRLLAPLLQVHAEDAKALPQLGREHPAVKRVKEYLQAYYTQKVSLQELAGVANMSPFHLARVFRQTVGVPPHAYQISFRGIVWT